MSGLPPQGQKAPSETARKVTGATVPTAFPARSFGCRRRLGPGPRRSLTMGNKAVVTSFLTSGAVDATMIPYFRHITRSSQAGISYGTRAASPLLLAIDRDRGERVL